METGGERGGWREREGTGIQMEESDKWRREREKWRRERWIEGG